MGIEINTTTNTVTVTEEAATIVEVVSAGPQGIQGDAGPDPWDAEVQVVSASGPLTINYSAGKHVRLTLTGSIVLTVSNWPAANKIARLTLETINNGAFGITWPAAVLWSTGVNDQPTASGRDMFVLTTTDSGTTIYGFVAGAGFS